MPRKRNSDGTRHGVKNANKQITPRKNLGVKRIKSQSQVYVGIDLHKEFMQVSAMDVDGNELLNEKIPAIKENIRRFFRIFPKKAKCVMESSSVWYGIFRYMTDELGLDVILSNPYQTKAIAASKKKTDKIDARILADLYRGGYIAQCHVPNKNIVDLRQLVRYRTKIVRMRAKLKNYIHSILLQNGIKIPGAPFSSPFIGRLVKLDDYRIDEYVRMIQFLDDRIMQSNLRIRDAVKTNHNAQILESIPGVGKFSALTLAAEIDDIGMFSDSHKLASFAGLVPSVRNSANTIRHGRITRRGSPMMRWVLVEAIHTHVRYAADSPISKFYLRLAKKRGSSKAGVAAAAKLLRMIYWMMKKDITFEKL